MIDNEAVFLAAMEDMEAKFASESVELRWRPIHAHMHFENRLGHDLPFSGTIDEREPVTFDGADLASRVARWYRARYGHRLDEPLGPGRVAFCLRGAHWAFRLPSFIFETQMVVRCGETDREVPPETGPEYADINVLDHIEHGPNSIDASLSDAERRHMVDLFVLGYEALSRLGAHDEDPLIMHSLADNEACVYHLTAPIVATGLAKWSALQSAEKALKAFIRIRGGSFGLSHNISKHTQDAIAAGLDGTAVKWTSAVQAPAGVRYGDVSVTEDEAILAHHAALQILRLVGLGLSS